VFVSDNRTVRSLAFVWDRPIFVHLFVYRLINSIRSTLKFSISIQTVTLIFSISNNFIILSECTPYAYTPTSSDFDCNFYTIKNHGPLSSYKRNEAAGRCKVALVVVCSILDD